MMVMALTDEQRIRIGRSVAGSSVVVAIGGLLVTAAHRPMGGRVGGARSGQCPRRRGVRGAGVDGAPPAASQWVGVGVHVRSVLRRCVLGLPRGPGALRSGVAARQPQRCPTGPRRIALAGRHRRRDHGDGLAALSVPAPHAGAAVVSRRSAAVAGLALGRLVPGVDADAGGHRESRPQQPLEHTRGLRGHRHLLDGRRGRARPRATRDRLRGGGARGPLPLRRCHQPPPDPVDRVRRSAAPLRHGRDLRDPGRLRQPVRFHGGEPAQSGTARRADRLVLGGDHPVPALRDRHDHLEVRHVLRSCRRDRRALRGHRRRSTVDHRPFGRRTVPGWCCRSSPRPWSPCCSNRSAHASNGRPTVWCTATG